MTSCIYLDNSTTAKPSENVFKAMLPFFKEYWGIPTAPHQKGQELYAFLSEYYQTLYAFIGAKEKDQVILTSSGTEAVNHVIASVYRDVTLASGKNQFLTSKGDEAATIMAMNRLEAFGCVTKMVEVNAEGIVTPELLADQLSPRTALLSLSWANGLTGVVQPIKDISALCRQRGIRFHLDVTHAIGKLFYDVEELGVDYLTCNGEQFHGPKGTGLLYVKQGIACSPFIFGSADQGGMRAGSLNLPALAGLACAAKEALESRDVVCTEIARLRYEFEKGILKGFPQAKVCFKNQERLPHCTTLLFPGISNEALLFALNRKGICASIGGGNFQQLALLLVGTGMEENSAHSAVSFSLSRYTTQEEIDIAIEKVVEAAQQLAKMSHAVFSNENKRE